MATSQVAISKVNLTRKHEDTLRFIFDLGEDVSGWSNFNLSVNTEKLPEDDTTEVSNVVGDFVNDGTDGLVYFTADGAIDAGKYYYAARGENEYGELATFVEGSYKVVENRVI